MDFNSDQGQAPFSDDPIMVLKGKFNEALQDDEGVSRHKTRAVSRLRNSSMLMELDSEEVVAWFADWAVCVQFLKKLHPAAVIKPRLYQVLVQFILLTFQPDRVADLCEIEEANSIDDGRIVRARWIKLVARCKPSQTCGHLILSFQSPQSTNDALAYGLVIGHKKVYVEKCKREPLQCLKCHGWGHIAVSCEAPREICGTCTLQHHTTTCTNGDNPWCMSCKAPRHASWDRHCPIFQQKCHELNKKINDNNMPYFPTLEPWTQVMEPPWSAPPLRKVAWAAPPTNRPIQLTLNWQYGMPTSGGTPPSQHRGAPAPLQCRSWDCDDFNNRNGPPHYHLHFYE